jgi:transposase
MSDVVTTPPPAGPTRRSRAFTREVWAERLVRFPDSGLTPAQFCALEAISLPSFYAWRRRLAADAADAVGNPPAPLLPVPLQAQAPAVELVLPSGAILRLPPGCDLAWVRAPIATLGGPSC